MTELVVCVFLHAVDAVFVEELHIVAGVAIEEIVSTHSEPEQVDLVVGVLCVVVDTRNVCRGKRAVAAQVRELVEVTQTI